jgi:2,4-dienoyl-CoA reductase-like NADH-dependent reductase (Old Yellow Enzyme family)
VEVTSFGCHLIEQFFDPAINDRDDQYGGSLQNRVRFAREVLAAVREATSDDFIIGFRMTADQHLPSGMSQEDLRSVVRALTADGPVDLLSRRAACSTRSPRVQGQECLLPRAHPATPFPTAAAGGGSTRRLVD